MKFQRLACEISSAWARCLFERPELPSTDTRARFKFSGVTTVETRVQGFRENITILTKIFNPLWNWSGFLEELHEEQGWNAFWRRVAWSQTLISLLRRNVFTANERCVTLHRCMMNESSDLAQPIYIGHCCYMYPSLIFHF